MISTDLYFTHIHILPTSVNALVCKNWYSNIITNLKKKKQTFYELQIYNLLINKYSTYPPQGYNIRRRLDFAENHHYIMIIYLQLHMIICSKAFLIISKKIVLYSQT